MKILLYICVYKRIIMLRTLLEGVLRDLGHEEAPKENEAHNGGALYLSIQVQCPSIGHHHQSIHLLEDFFLNVKVRCGLYTACHVSLDQLLLQLLWW